MVNYTLSDDERSVVKTRALQTLRRAYERYDIRFVEGARERRVIRVEDTPRQRRTSWGIRRESSDSSAMDGWVKPTGWKKLRYTSSAGEWKSAAIKSSSENCSNV